MLCRQSRVTESGVEEAALDWLGGLDYEVLSGRMIAPGETPAEHLDYKQVLLLDPLQTKLLPSELHMPAPDKITESRA